MTAQAVPVAPPTLRREERHMVQRTPMTREGHARLQQELEQLKRVDRPAIIKAIAEARAHGDLSENAEYHAAKERQGFIEARIRELEAKVSGAEVLEPPRDGTRVTFGSTVRLRAPDGKEVRYQIVGSDEADPAAGRISILSPIARTLIGKEVGDEVKVQAPGGARELEIVAANFPWEAGGAS
jgi:transcription elongation factor GreA